MDATGEEAAVRASLDDALGDLIRAAVENPTEPDTDNCSRIDAVLGHRMAPYRHLAWALAEAEALKRRLKAGLHVHTSDVVGEAHGTRGHDLAELRL